MHENGLGYLNHVMVAGLVGHALAEAVLGEDRDGADQRERQERDRKRRERMARVLRALAARLSPPASAPEAAPAA